MSVKSQIKVVVRVRPYTATEQSKLEPGEKDNSIFEFLSPQTCAIGAHTFNFDKVFTADTNQQQLFYTHFNEYVDNVLDGFNSTVVAFGQTAAGKSHTMTGGTSEETEGIIPRAVRRIFANEAGIVTATYVQIYGEKLQDLFNQKLPVTMLGDGSLKDIRAVQASTVTELLAVIRQANSLRATAATSMNSASSRSHAILNFQLENGAKLMLVDLAGSEIVRKTGASGQVLSEAGSINKSLTSLAMVISSLSQSVRPKHIPYRGSKLTQMLQDALGGNSKTTIVINCSPSAAHLAETVSSLRFGTRAKLIHSDVPHKEERQLCGFLMAWELKITEALQSWRLKGPTTRSEWFDMADMENLVEQLKASGTLLTGVQEEIRELEKLREIDTQEDLEQIHSRSDIAELDAKLEEAEMRVRVLKEEVHESKMRSDHGQQHHCEDHTAEISEIENLSREISGQDRENEELRRILAQIRAQSTCERVTSYLKQLEIDILACSQQIEALTGNKRPKSSSEDNSKRVKVSII